MNAKLLVMGSGHFSLCAAMISDAICFITPWAKTGSELKFEELINVDPQRTIVVKHVKTATSASNQRYVIA